MTEQPNQPSLAAVEADLFGVLFGFHKEALVVVMYTLKRGADGQLQGPINKQVWGTFAGRKAAALWARAAATKRGFEPGTTKTVQIVLDGAQGLKQNLEPLFAGAIFTLDVCHVVEKLGLQSTLRPRGRPRKSDPATI